MDRADAMGGQAMLRHEPGWVVLGLTLLLGLGCGREGEAPQGPVSNVDVPVIGNPHARYCPVDGEAVALADALRDATLRLDHQGEVYVFCREACRETFATSPDRYIRDPAAPRPDKSLAAEEPAR